MNTVQVILHVLAGVDPSGLRTMQLHQIRCFLRTVEDLHFRRAALALGISQPSLSRAIQLLNARSAAS